MIDKDVREMLSNYLLDKTFLKQLDATKNKSIYAKITLLTLNEEPVSEIQGKITQGSINIDGNSAIRRTCSLTMVTFNQDINDTHWALRNKFKLEIGIENLIDKRYPNIIWFKQGIFLFTSLNMSKNSNNFTINLQGKDKMCMLNGECGGGINASTDLAQLEEIEYEYLPISLTRDQWVLNTYYFRPYKPGGFISKFEDLDNYQYFIKELVFNKQNDFTKDNYYGQIINEEDDKNQKTHIFFDIASWEYDKKKAQQGYGINYQNYYYYIHVWKSEYLYEKWPLALYIQDHEGTKVEIKNDRIYCTTDDKAVSILFKTGNKIISKDENQQDIETDEYKIVINEEFFNSSDFYADKYWVHAWSEEKQTYILEPAKNWVKVDENNKFISKFEGKDPPPALLKQYYFQTTSFNVIYNEVDIETDEKGEIITAPDSNEIYYKIQYSLPCQLATKGYDFDTEKYRYYSKKELSRTLTSLNIIDIIKNCVHVYGNEPYKNIIINDVEDYGLELLEYRGENALYLFRLTDTGEITTATEYYTDFVSNSLEEKNFKYYSLSPQADNTHARTVEKTIWPYLDQSPKKYHIIKIEYGQTAGYRLTDFTYPGELIANVGESVMSVLDKIKQTFSDFEYFYDIDGRFVFQKKKTYINQSWNNLKTDSATNEIYVENLMYNPEEIYTFSNGILNTAISNAPQLNNFKNDFSIWGNRDGVSGAQIPIHMRYAIDTKPEYYKPIEFEYKETTEVTEDNYQPNKYYYINPDGKYIIASSKQFIPNMKYFIGVLKDPDDIVPYATKSYQKQKDEKIKEVDWREIIYQMAADYYKNAHILDNFNSVVGQNNKNYYPDGITGYEQYYIDIQGFWRGLYNPEAIGQKVYEEIGTIQESQFNATDFYTLNSTSKEYELATSYSENVTYYMKSNWIELGYNYDLSHAKYNVQDGWNKNVTDHPELLNFWFDFMNINGAMGKYSQKIIGHRAKNVNNDKVSAIFYLDTPTLIFYETEKERENATKKTGYTLMSLGPFKDYFTVSAQGRSAQDELSNLLYQHLHFSEAITLTSIPIYHLEPNNIIYIKDDELNINSKYIITKITIPLQYNGTSSINATKVIERVY